MDYIEMNEFECAQLDARIERRKMWQDYDEMIKEQDEENERRFREDF